MRRYTASLHCRFAIVSPVPTHMISRIQSIHYGTCRLVAFAGIVALSMASTLQAQDAAAMAKPTGKWTANITQLGELRGAAELSVQPRNDKESRARLSLRAVPINRQIAWDIVAGRCGDEGRPVAAAAAFRQILSRNDGSGDGMATIPLLEPGKLYYVRVFAPGSVPADRGGFGCANLSEVQ